MILLLEIILYIMKVSKSIEQQKLIHMYPKISNFVPHFRSTLLFIIQNEKKNKIW